MKKLISLLLTAVISIAPIYSVSANRNFVVIREPVYNMADSFYSNVTKVSKGTMWGICDTNGYPLTGYQWEAMGEITDELIPARKNNLWGYISYDGKEIIPYEFQKAENFVGDLARVLTADGVYAYINRTGEILFTSPFDYSFAPGDELICGVLNGLYGYCNTDGEIVVFPQFDMGFDFCEGYAAVKFGEKWGYITKEGQYLVKPAYDYAGDFYKGYAVCKLPTGYGIIDTSGNKCSSFEFDYIGECGSDGRFPAKAGDTCGYINAQGKWLMQLDYDFCYAFTDGVARVFKDNLWGYIDELGQEIVAPQFADCGEYRNGRAFFSTDGTVYGFLTLDTENYKIEGPSEDVVLPINPPKPPQETPTETKDATVGTYEEIIALDDLDNLPTFPGEEKCVSMRIGSPYALKIENAKKLAAAPTLIDGVTMVPLRDVVEYIGGTITWDERTKRTNIRLRNNVVILTIGSKVCFVNGIASVTSSAPQLIDGVTMIPVRCVTESLGCDIEWIPETQNICVRYK